MMRIVDKRWKQFGPWKNALSGGFAKILVFFCYLLLLSGCQLNAPDEGWNGRITLWHSWSPGEAVVLNDTLAQFQEILSDVHISTVSFPYDQLLAEFILAGAEG